MLTKFKSVNKLTSFKRRYMQYAFIFVGIIFFLLTLVGCCSAPETKSNHREAELTVEYNGKKVHERKPQIKAPLRDAKPKLVFNNIHDLKSALGSQTRPLVIIYSANWCKPCHTLNKELIKRSLRDRVLILNVDEQWVSHFVLQYNIRGVPTMHVIGMNNKLYTFEGLAPILRTLTVIL